MNNKVVWHSEKKNLPSSQEIYYVDGLVSTGNNFPTQY